MCPTRIPVASRDEKGFELMAGMKVQTKAKKISGSLVSEAAYALTASADITENTRWRLAGWIFSPPLTNVLIDFQTLTVDLPFNRDIFPEGLPPSYVFVATLRLKGPSSKLTFDLWRVLSMDKKIQAAVTLNGKDKTVALATTGVAVKEQSAVFKSGFQVRGFPESSVEQQLPV